MAGRKKKPRIAAGRKREASLSDTSSVCSDNPFDILPEQEAGEMEVTNNETIQNIKSLKKEKVPPIVVTISSEFNIFKKELSTFVSDVKVTYQIGRRGECRLLADSVKGRDRLVQYLTDKMYKFFTYDTKNAKPFKVVLKGLTNDQTVDEIKLTLTELLGIAPTQVILMKQKSRGENSQRTGISLVNYLIHFNRNEVNNLKFFEKAHALYNVRVKWEIYRKYGGGEKHITQCRTCQRYGHGSKFCNMDQKCLNCGDSSHKKDTCPVKESKNFRCANCNGNHMSNFYQCPVRLAIVKARQGKQNSISQLKPTSKQNSPSVPVTHSLPTPLHTRLTYAQVTGSSNIIPPSVGSSKMTVNMGKQNTLENNCTPITPANIATENIFSNVNCLGPITAGKLSFLQQAMFDLMNAMLQAKSMFEAIQIGTNFTIKIVSNLKFSNDFK